GCPATTPGPRPGPGDTGRRGVGQLGAVNRRAALGGALLVTLTTPATWPLALAAFLLRGGFLLVTIPIVVLPTPVGLGNVLAPWITPLALGSITPAFVAVTPAPPSSSSAGWSSAAGRRPPSRPRKPGSSPGSPPTTGRRPARRPAARGSRSGSWRRGSSPTF